MQHTYLTVAEAAQYLGISATAVRRRVNRGTMPGVRRLGSRSIRIDKAELDRAMLEAALRNGGRDA